MKMGPTAESASGSHRAELKGHRQHPLTKSDVWQHLVNEARSRVRHAPGVAARTDAALLAGEGDEEHRSTGLATSTSEAMSVDAAFLVRLELFLDVLREAAAILASGLSQERSEVLICE
jgi:hypothetical protein